MLEPGFDTGVILVVDKIAVESLLSPMPGQEPFVWAVDVKFRFQIGDQLPQGEPPTDKYPGYFRVTLSAAVTEMWPLLKAGAETARSLWDPNSKVWTGVDIDAMLTG